MTTIVRGFVVATKCETAEAFVEKYHTRIDEDSIFVGVVEERVLGSECAFAILLANQQPVFAGICAVLDVFRDTNNPFRRRGMRLGIRRLGVTSEHIFAEMAKLRASQRRFPRGSDPPETEAADGIPIDIDDESSHSIPIDFDVELTAPSLVHQ
ncbi:MAG TPA: hypothetical protein VIV40_16870 [Kofleriaceae bacterium]